MTPKEITRCQWQRLNNLQNISKKPILIKIKEGAIPEGADFEEYIWVDWKIYWSKVKNPIYTRGILPNEVCLDPDVKNWDVLKEELTKLHFYCKDKKIPIEFAYSGGSGIHGHLFLNGFELDTDILKKVAQYDIDISKIVRDTVLDLILREAGASRQRLEIDNGKVTFDKNGKGSMIREFGTTRKDGYYKSFSGRYMDRMMIQNLKKRIQDLEQQDSTMNKCVQFPELRRLMQLADIGLDEMYEYFDANAQQGIYPSIEERRALIPEIFKNRGDVC